jgi:hypothetical protein
VIRALPFSRLWRLALRRVVAIIALGLGTTVVIAFVLGSTVRLKGGATKVTRDLNPETERFGKIVLFFRRRQGAVLYQSTVFSEPVSAHDQPYIGDPLAFTPEWARNRLMPWLLGLRPWPESMETSCIVAAGWPKPALYSWFENHRYPESGRFDIKGGLSVARWSERFDTRVIPLTPIWSGLAINTAVYASIWTALLYGPRAARRVGRGRRGLCTSCGYDLLGESEHGCPECGWGRS